MEIWEIGLLCSVGAALTCAALLPSTMLLAPYIGAVDIPRQARRMHSRPIPRCAGMAMFVAFWGIVVALNLADVALLPLLFSTALLLLLGLADDVFGLPALHKLLLQGVAALAIVLPGELGTGAWIGGVLWLCLVTNAHNMIDGIDGLCGMVTAWECAGAALLLWQLGDDTGAIVALAALGVCLGYLPFNVHPARVFMGDEGALFLGFLVGWLSLRVYEAGGSLLCVLLLCFLPVFDLVLAVVRRLMQGKNPLRADRGHLHHLLCDAGFSQRTVCRFLSFLSLLAVLLALFCHAHPE